MWTIFFGPERVSSMTEVRTADRTRFGRFFHGMLERGVYLPPSAFESAFLCDAHAESEIDRTLEAADEAMEGIA
jgi:glutamate-1-semialdehyde 2,1-aminomutase